MGRPIPLLNGATSTGKGTVAKLTGDAVAVQGWIAAGSATVLIKASNDPRALTDPANAAWDTIATMTLSGANDQATLRDIVPSVYVVAEVSAVVTGPVYATLSEA